MNATETAQRSAATLAGMSDDMVVKAVAYLRSVADAGEVDAWVVAVGEAELTRREAMRAPLKPGVRVYVTDGFAVDMIAEVDGEPNRYGIVPVILPCYGARSLPMSILRPVVADQVDVMAVRPVEQATEQTPDTIGVGSAVMVDDFMPGVVRSFTSTGRYARVRMEGVGTKMYAVDRLTLITEVTEKTTEADVVEQAPEVVEQVEQAPEVTEVPAILPAGTRVSPVFGGFAGQAGIVEAHTEQYGRVRVDMGGTLLYFDAGSLRILPVTEEQVVATGEHTLRVVGTNDEQTTCDRCGKVELRGTVIIADEYGEVGRYGTTCAGYVLDPTGRTRITRRHAETIEAVRRQSVWTYLRRARAALRSAGDPDSFPPAHVQACQWVVILERDVPLIRPEEVRAVREIRTEARAMRAELRAAGRL